MTQAKCQADGKIWIEAHDVEWNQILRMNTFSENKTKEEMEALGFDTKRAISLETLMAYKKGASGQLLKCKVRVMLAAHLGVCSRGFEYFITFSASPACATERVLQYLVVD